MSLKVGEIGKTVRVGTSYDISAFSSLEVRLKDPSGLDTVVSSPRVTAPGVDVLTPYGNFEAGTYMQFTTEAADFYVAGTWTVCGVYFDSSPKEYHGDSTTFVVEEAC